MYEPEVDDYVKWTNSLGQVHEGWVYFKGDPVNNALRKKQGWNEVSQYITIEIHSYPKSDHVYSSGKFHRHRNVHCLILCNRENWGELEYIKNRRGTIEGCSDHKTEDLYKGYKSQEGRYSDIQ